MAQAIIQIRDYDFELPDGHSAVSTGSGRITLRDGSGRASTYELLKEVDTFEEKRFVLDHDVPPTFIVGEAYPLQSAEAELRRLLKLWDAKFGHRSGYTTLRGQLGEDTVGLFRAIRVALA